MSRQAISSTGGAAIGPYSHGVDSDGLVFLSGQTPLDPATGALTTGDIGAQTRRSMDNLFAVLESAKLTGADVIKCNVYLTDMADFPGMNTAYATYFDEPYPARTTIAVAGLPLGARVEIEMIARRPASELSDKGIDDR